VLPDVIRAGDCRCPPGQRRGRHLVSQERGRLRWWRGDTGSGGGVDPDAARPRAGYANASRTISLTTRRPTRGLEVVARFACAHCGQLHLDAIRARVQVELPLSTSGTPSS